MEQHVDDSSESVRELYRAWREAEAKACRIYDEVNDDCSHPRFIEASRKAYELLRELLKPNPSVHAVLSKLQVACYFEDYRTDAANPECTDVAPHAVVSAIHDLETLIGSVG